MEVPLVRPTDTNGETESAVGLIAQGFFSKEGLAPDQNLVAQTFGPSARCNDQSGQGIPSAGIIGAPS